MAAAPLSAGTLVLHDTPLLLLPEEGEELCCTCTSPATSRCPHCGIWLCCPEQHLEECGVVRRWRGDEPGLLTALGLLRLLKEVSQASGLSPCSQDQGVVEGLESHLGVRRATRGWGELVEGVVRPMALHSMAGMPGVPPGVTEEHLESLLAIILSNQVSTGQGTSALFPVFPLLHRACLPTCRWWVEEGRVTVRVATQVDRGQRLTVAYRCKPPSTCHLSPQVR